VINNNELISAPQDHQKTFRTQYTKHRYQSPSIPASNSPNSPFVLDHNRQQSIVSTMHCVNVLHNNFTDSASN